MPAASTNLPEIRQRNNSVEIITMQALDEDTGSKYAIDISQM